MKRRQFVRHATRTAILPALFNGTGMAAFARSPLFQALGYNQVDTDKVLVLIYLGGGNDGLNTVVPVDQYDILQKARPDVVLPEDVLLNLDGVDDVRFHPSLGGFRDLYDDGNRAVIQNVGYPDQNFSHFRSTDIWMTGADSEEVLATGWLGRYLDTEYPNYPQDYPNSNAPDPLAIEIGYNLSVAFQGPVTGMGMVVGDPDWFYQLVEEADDVAPDTKAGDKLNYIRLVARQSQVYGEVIKNAASKVTQQQPYPDTGLGQQLKIIARLIAGGLKTRLYMVSINGFDTHDSQVMAGDHTMGEHADLLQTLGDAVNAFTRDLKSLDIEDRVVGATVSEFGRRIISNASLGTDHGAAAPMFVFGKSVLGGVYGSNPQLPANPTVQDNLEMEFDFRSVYASLLQSWFCADTSVLQQTLNNDYNIIPFIDPAVCGTSTSIAQHNFDHEPWIQHYPNPVRDQVTIRFRWGDQAVQIQLVNAAGQMIAQIAQGKFGGDTQQTYWNASHLVPGLYYLTYRSGQIRQTSTMVKL